MLTTEDFIIQFSKYTNQELFEIFHNIEGYSNEAKLALQHVIETKGGINKLTESIALDEQKTIEIKRIEKEIYDLVQDGFEKEFVKKAISSTILSEENIQEILSKNYSNAKKDILDKVVDKQTVGRCIMAGIIATLFSGCALGALLIYTQAIHMLIIVGVALLCYAIINGIVKKSKNNSAVIITTSISTFLSICLGQLLLMFFGNIQ